MTKRIRLTALWAIGILLGTGCGQTSSPKNPGEACDNLLADARRYAKIQEFETATQYALQAYELAQGNSGMEDKQAEALCELADLDLMTWRDEQAWNHACEAEKIARKRGLETILTEALIHKGKVCLFSGITPEEARDDEALAYFEEARGIAERKGTIETRVNILSDISQVYINKNRFNNPIDPDLYRQAGDYLARAEDLGKRGGMLELDAKILPIKIRYLRQGGRIQEAIDCCNHVIAITPEKNYLQKEQSYYQLVMLYGIQGKAQEGLDFLLAFRLVAAADFPLIDGLRHGLHRNLLSVNPVFLAVRGGIRFEPAQLNGHRSQQDDHQHGRRRDGRSADEGPFPFLPGADFALDRRPQAVKIAFLPRLWPAAQLCQEAEARVDIGRVDVPAVLGQLRVDHAAQAVLQFSRRDPAGPKAFFQLFSPLLRFGETHNVPPSINKVLMTPKRF